MFYEIIKDQKDVVSEYLDKDVVDGIIMALNVMLNFSFYRKRYTIGQLTTIPDEPNGLLIKPVIQPF